MTDEEWTKWGRTLSLLIDRVNLKDDLEELEYFADGIQQNDSEGDEALSRNDGTGWTWHMGGDWMEPIQALQDHLEKFEPKEFDAYAKRRASAHEVEENRGR